MALETLKNIKEIGGFPVVTTEDANKIFKVMTSPTGISKPMFTDEEWTDWRSKHPIMINHEANTISFRIQNGPIKEVGINGCQVDTIIHAAKKILEGLNAKFPSEYNELAINKLGMALAHLAERTKNREQRGVEGTSNA